MISEQVMILVPVKNLSNAKQRLSPILNPDERFTLAQAMCEDVLQALADWPSRPAVAVVTSDPFACTLATRFNFEVVADDENGGETSAIAIATAICCERGARTTLVIPADIPLIESADLQKIVDAAPLQGTVLVTDAAARGTNAAWRSPANLFPLRFGNDSFLPHLASAKATGLPCVVLDLPSLARDVDRPEDLRELAAADGERRAQRLVRSWNLEKRIKSAMSKSAANTEQGRSRLRESNGEPREIRILPIAVDGEVLPGEKLSQKLLAAARKVNLDFHEGDILVVKHKVVSKAEGALVDLDKIHPSPATRRWARRHSLDARVSELALRESRRIVRQKNGVLITETRHGLICANSGVDVSNVDGGRHAVLLPKNPDQSAARLRLSLKKQLGVEIAVIVSDSFGRPWREGLTEVAIGVSGMRPLVDYRGRRDPHRYSLHATIDAVADELACAAGLVCGKLAATPACIIRGYSYKRGNGSGRELIRPAERDLFR